MKNYIITYENWTKNRYKECKRMVNSTNLGLDNSKRIVGEEPKRKDEITAADPRYIQFKRSQGFMLNALGARNGNSFDRT